MPDDTGSLIEQPPMARLGGHRLARFIGADSIQSSPPLTSSDFAKLGSLLTVWRGAILLFSYLWGRQGVIPHWPDMWASMWLWRYSVSWDAGWYLTIARDGYGYQAANGNAPAVSWFPALPLLIRAVHTVMPGSDVLAAATKQTDGLYISHYYNWRPGTYHGLHTYIEIYQLKPEAPADAVDVLSRATLQPLLERWVADKTLVEYEIDEPVFHTEPSRSFFVNYMLQDPQNLERVDAALAHALEANSTAADLIDFKTYRGSLSRTRVAVFK